MHEKQIDRISALVSDLFLVDAYYIRGHQWTLSLRYRYDADHTVALLEERLKLAGYTFTIDPSEDMLTLTVDSRRRLYIPRLNILLFAATVLTVYLVPALSFGWDLAGGGGLLFTFALMSILLVHEMGHYIASRRRGIVTSFPYFIPAPNFIGTFGAIIKTKSPFWNRRDLLEVGAAGPIAGWIVALFWLIYGLSTAVGTVATDPPADTEGMIIFGESLLIKLLEPIFMAPMEPGTTVAITEPLLAGWVGLLVTALNMLPIGQLDGGHVAYGLAPRKQVWLARLGMVGLAALGYWYPMWWLFAGLGFYMGLSHPPTLDDSRAPSRTALIMGWVSLVILVLSFTPVPLRFL
ncbi:MAG: site-2 protease family protein [candidate division Zixibacteria bacterium]|nr:site-2 protease family protein [candidate division Zixibacteria bacterium]